MFKKILSLFLIAISMVGNSFAIRHYDDTGYWECVYASDEPNADSDFFDCWLLDEVTKSTAPYNVINLKSTLKFLSKNPSFYINGFYSKHQYHSDSPLWYDYRIDYYDPIQNYSVVASCVTKDGVLYYKSFSNSTGSSCLPPDYSKVSSLSDKNDI